MDTITQALLYIKGALVKLDRGAWYYGIAGKANHLQYQQPQLLCFQSSPLVLAHVEQPKMVQVFGTSYPHGRLR